MDTSTNTDDNSKSNESNNCYTNQAFVLNETKNDKNIKNFTQLNTILVDLKNDQPTEKKYDSTEEELFLISVNKVPKKDFKCEIRALRDVEYFLNDLVILLNLSAIDLRQVIYHLVQEMVKQCNIKASISKIMTSLLSDEKGCLFSNRIQGIFSERDGVYNYDQSWICILGSVLNLKKRSIGIIKLKNTLNLGADFQEIKFLIIILTPSKEKITKNAYETGRTFATLFADVQFRFDLLQTDDVEKARKIIQNRAKYLTHSIFNETELSKNKTGLDTNLIENINRRSKCYFQDFIDGMANRRAIHKTASTVLFLFFSILLPCIAFGELNSKNTNGKIDAQRAIIGQAIGGLIFSFIGGQPLVIISTTALVSLYIKVIHEMCNELKIDFYTIYAAIGIWNSFFVMIYSATGLSKLIKYSTRSIEEIFAMFIVVCFFFDAFRDCFESFQLHYFSEACVNPSFNASNLFVISNNSEIVQIGVDKTCRRDITFFYLILMLGTVWLSIRIFEFNSSPFLSSKMREFVSDYALPISVVFFSFVNSYFFKEVKVEGFSFTENFSFSRAKIEELPWTVLAISGGLGLVLSFLFFMDQNITGQIVNSPMNNLKKGSAPHLDLLSISIINLFLSFFGLPWMHGILPISPLHVRCLADIEEHNNQGHISQVIVKVRETRLTSLFCHILITLTLFMIPYPLSYIPVPVLDGLFLYCALASLRGNSLFERICLLFTEQSSYPPNHYIRKCPQAKIHLFTFCEIVQLFLLIFVGFAPWAYLRLAFPVFIALLIPTRHFIIPLIIDKKILKPLDAFQ